MLPRQDPADPDHDLEAILRSIDLTTIDLSAHRPRTGFERDTSAAFGLSRRDAPDIVLPPLPGQGLDGGPDLGL